MTTVLLAAIAVLLAGPLPALMARAPALRRTPRTAVLAWQAVALAAVLAALGAGLSLTTSHGLAVDGLPPVALAVATVALMLTALVLGRLLLSAHRTGIELRSLRRRHREQLDLLAREEQGVAVVEHEVPVAYCVPALGRHRVVVSAGALGRLAEDEVAAVLAHERAHLRARHDLVLEAFGVLHRAFPRWVSSAAALEEVAFLVEVLADRAAVRHGDPRPLARALVALAGARTPRAALGATGTRGLAARVELLADLRPHRVQAAGLALGAVLVLVLPTAFVALPWLASLAP